MCRTRAAESSRRRRSSARRDPGFACSLFPPLAFRLRLERGEGVRPEVVEVVAKLADSVRIEPVEPPRAVSTLRHEPRLLEDAQMLRDRGPADRQLRRNLAHRERLRPQALEDLSARRVTERIHR